ncbi:MAG: YihY/virulence factor BrkB family protein [Myxococcales bacterium]|nr:YihY/virulence factor BrkB family protein [Myxococcales bacterium]
MRYLIKDVWWSYRLHDGPLLSGAVAFYGLLAFAPFGVIALVTATALFGPEAGRSELVGALTTFIGPEASQLVADAVGRLASGGSSVLATLLSAGFAIFAGNRLFLMLHAALNHVWGVRSTAPVGLKGHAFRILRRRLISFAMVLLFGAGLVLFVGMKAAIAAAASRLGGISIAYRLLEFLISVAVMTLLLTLVYRWLPDVRIRTVDILPGALLTAVLAGLGSLLFGAYLVRYAPGTLYGAAGSIVIVLLWFFYSAQIFFFGAEVVGAWARHRGEGIRPLRHAAPVVVQERQTIV